MIWVLGVAAWEKVHYSIDDGPAVAWGDLTLRTLAPDFHTVRASEQQPAGWTGWSDPYAFSISGAAPLAIIAFCDASGSGDTSEECDAAPVTRAGPYSLWRRGVVEPDNLRYSIDGGSAVAADDLDLSALSDGRHNNRIGEQQPAGWTGWSEPYWFTMAPP